MKVRIRLDDELVEEARELARGAGRSLSAVLDDALRQHLAQQQAPGSVNECD
jgi:predicted transcriptional regulator